MSHTSPQPQEPPEPDYEWCYKSVQRVSRTFALTVDVLEEPMSRHICLGYLLCRVADTIEDAAHIDTRRQADLLRLYEAALDPSAETTIGEFRASVDPWVPPAEERTADWDVVAGSPTVFATFAELPEDVQEAVRPPVQEMVGGMAMFVERYAEQGGLRIRDRDELEEYCYYAAGTVGTLITNLLTRDDVADRRAETMHDTAEAFGLLLQLVNVSKDVYDDYSEENNVYLPAEWLAAEGVPQEAVTAPEHRTESARVVSRTADLARSCLDEAQAYLEAMPLHDGNTLSAWLVPYVLAVGTLRELDERPEDALTQADVKVSRSEVFAVLEAASSASRETVADLRETIARGPFHRVSGRD
ncbi:MAG: phytoene/squalene synthase family protein [Halobacteriota archaeon]|uniref:phytoene/squalene synthase family protein n=1 Tax=Natronomonas sp. TaxID=2184060 RepID=UPI00397480B0